MDIDTAAKDEEDDDDDESCWVYASYCHEYYIDIHYNENVDVDHRRDYYY